MDNLNQLRLQGLDVGSYPLPSFSSLSNLRFLSLSEGRFEFVTGDTFTDLDQLQVLYMDQSQV